MFSWKVIHFYHLCRWFDWLFLSEFLFLWWENCWTVCDTRSTEVVSSVQLRFVNADPIIGSNSRRGSAVEAGYRRETKGLGMTGSGYVEIGSGVLLELKAEVSLGIRKKKNICFSFNVKWKLLPRTIQGERKRALTLPILQRANAEYLSFKTTSVDIRSSKLCFTCCR